MINLEIVISLKNQYKLTYLNKLYLYMFFILKIKSITY